MPFSSVFIFGYLSSSSTKEINAFEFGSMICTALLVIRNDLKQSNTTSLVGV